MKKLFALLIGLMVSATAMAEPSGDYQTISISDSLTKTEKKVRSSAVKITDGYGHGSGGIVQYYDLQLVFTAQHVANGVIGGTYYAMKNGEIKETVLIYSDSLHDMSILYLLQDFNYAKPLKFSPRKNILEVGEEITYSGFPSDHKLMTFRGRVAGYEMLDDAGMQILLHTHGWFGCSGSLVYDSAGDVVGVLWGIDVEYVPSGSAQAIDNLMWVSPIQNLNMKFALAALCDSKNNKHRACR